MVLRDIVRLRDWQNPNIWQYHGLLCSTPNLHSIVDQLIRGSVTFTVNLALKRGKRL
jgi:hypothetical protein